MLEKETILNYLNSIHEHKMAKEIFVHVLKKMGLKGVKYTGGPDETGIDIEYYELTQPEEHKSYVGIQFKKNDLVYSSGGSKNSVKEVKNQAEEAFDKEIYDTDSRSHLFISRFIVATTGDINEKARYYIGKARLKGKDRRIDYWTGDRLAEYIQTHWEDEFIKYFDIPESEESEVFEAIIVDSEFIEDNHKKLVNDCKKIKSILSINEWSIIDTILSHSIENDTSSISLADLLLGLGNTEEYYEKEFKHLIELGFIDVSDNYFSLKGHTKVLHDLYLTIVYELEQAEENIDDAPQFFYDLIK